jgi:serine protease
MAFGRVREAIDPDDFRSGFAVWSGTSFAAPLMAGAVAAALLEDLEPPGEPVVVDRAVRRAWDVLERLTSITS